MKHFIGLLLMAVMMIPAVAFGQENAEPEGTEVKDTVNRDDPNFVIASVMVAEPTDVKDDFIGVLGHMFIRLQCKQFGLDNIYSYESESVEEEFGSFLAGKMTMGMFRIGTETYLEDYRKWNRAVHEYTLNLPPKEKTELWRELDRRVDEGRDLQFDLIKRGCVKSVVDAVETVLTTNIEYKEWPERFTLSRREMLGKTLEDYSWVNFLVTSFSGTVLDADCGNEEKIFIPQDLIDVWTKATYKGQPLLTYKGDIVECPVVKHEDTWFTPMVMMIVLLVVTIALSFTTFRYWDYLMLGLQAAVGLLLLYLSLISSIQTTGWWMLMLIYTPLPALLWKWRRKWGLAYSIALVVFAIAALCWPHRIVELPHLVFALTPAVICGKDTVKTLIKKTQKK